MKTSNLLNESDLSYTAFAKQRRIATGTPAQVAVAVKEYLWADNLAEVLTFDDSTGKVVDLDLRGTVKAVAKRYDSPGVTEPEQKAGPGRPKLGVVAREVTLLPRHWEWLSAQPGGASATLRKLVEDVRLKSHAKDLLHQGQDATYRFMTAMAGDLPGYEEALRAFYAKEFEKFRRLMRHWPVDVREHVWKLASPVTQSD